MKRIALITLGCVLLLIGLYGFGSNGGANGDPGICFAGLGLAVVGGITAYRATYNWNPYWHR